MKEKPNDYKIKFGVMGLSRDQVTENRRKYGSNEQVNKGRTTALHCVRRAFTNPFSLILFVLAVVSFITDVLLSEKYGQSFSSVIIICAMLLLGGIVRLIQELRAKRVADNLAKMTQTTVSVFRDDAWQEISSDELVVGDFVRLEAGDRVPADIELNETKDLFVSQSVITGESESFEKKAREPHERPEKLSDYINVLFQGTTVTGGLTQGNWVEAFLFALSVAVGLTPELLPMVVSACLAKGSYQMGKENTVVKNINAMQTLGSMDVLCVDKTGTLTDDTIILEYYMDILGNESQTVLDYAFLNSHYHSGVKNHLDTAVLRYGEIPAEKEHFGELLENRELLDEQPFDYAHKYVGVLLKGETENLHIIKGSVKNVLAKCKYAEFHGQKIEIEDDTLQSVYDVTDELTEDGMKVLAVAYRNTSATVLDDGDSDFILIGYLVFFDAPKKSASETINNLKKLNVDVRVLTGDDVKTTLSVCNRLQIETEHVLTGEAFEKISENEIPVIVEKTKVFAELTPRQKSRIIEVLQKNGHSVGFMGDGMNDLSAELKANVGISVDTAADAVKESADVILLEKDLNVLKRSILEGRKAFANMMSVHLIFLNLIYDLSCTAIPWDNVDEEFIAVPRKWDASSVGSFMIWLGPTSSIFDFTTYIFMYFVFCPMFVSGGVLYNDLASSFSGAELAEMQFKYMAMFQAGWFVESMWSQTLVIHMIRTPKLPFIQSRASAPLTLMTMTGIAVLTIIPFTPFGTMLGFVALPASYFLYLIPCILLYMLLATSLKKAYVRHYGELL